MDKKYHIGRKGNPTICTAIKNKCTLSNEHFKSKEEAFDYLKSLNDTALLYRYTIRQTLKDDRINCAFCDKETDKIGGNGRNRKYCSVQCSSKAAKQREKEARQKRKADAGFIDCRTCTEKVPALNKQGHRRIYCSAKCKSDNKVIRLKGEAEQRRQEKIKCDYCDKETSKYNPRKGTPKRFCSKQCGRSFDHAERKRKRNILYEERIRNAICKQCGKLLKDAKNKTIRTKIYCSSKCKVAFHTLIKRKPFLVPVYVFTDRDWKKLKNRFNNCCAYCSAKLPLALDHIIPITKGGYHRPGNFLPSCKRCNSSKGNKTVVEWRIYLKRKGITVNKNLPFINLNERHIIFPNSVEDYDSIKDQLINEFAVKPYSFNKSIFRFYNITEEELVKNM